MKTNNWGIFLLVVLSIFLINCSGGRSPTGTWEHKDSIAHTTMTIESDGVVTMDLKYTTTPQLDGRETFKYREFSHNRLVFENGRVWTYDPESHDFIAPDGVHFVKIR